MSQLYLISTVQAVGGSGDVASNFIYINNLVRKDVK